MMVTDNRNFHHRKFTQLTRVRIKMIVGKRAKTWDEFFLWKNSWQEEELTCGCRCFVNLKWKLKDELREMLSVLMMNSWVVFLFSTCVTIYIGNFVDIKR